MKNEKDTIIKARAIIARAETLPPIPATTPEMIGHYRKYLQLGHQDRELLLLSPFIPLGPQVTANPDADPFVIRLSDPTRPEGRVAYLLLRNGAVEWRYHHAWIRHARCPIVHDPVLMQWLDGLFAAFYLDAGLPGSLDGALEMLGPWDRVRWVQTNLFEGGRPEETLTEEIDVWVYDLSYTAPLEQFLCWVSEGLDKDGEQFRYTACCEGEDAEFYFLRYGKREAMAFPNGQPEPLRYLAGIVNGILQPDYELRRFRDKKLGKDGILMPLAPNDWETLTTAYGPMAIEARFTPLHAPKKQRLVYPMPR
ncbi:hypothetical protein GCM10007415_31380 [Parapedobacter pyrenivorans]|uniref:Uncharacterized protein n=1 Tax=Parapedobacter pyrenivorans TaxID=1305674 RepID=A0A917HW54_9SPHI|nr:hypothetical protein [Parapedobacter pyrenivorans]GGG94058.1 hypothetical protein GCM10007415_31380 [Parapedobacter pyrenivorans]